MPALLVHVFVPVGETAVALNVALIDIAVRPSMPLATAYPLAVRPRA